MLGFRSQASAEIILSGIEMDHMMRKRQARLACDPDPSLKVQFIFPGAEQIVSS